MKKKNILWLAASIIMILALTLVSASACTAPTPTPTPTPTQTGVVEVRATDAPPTGVSKIMVTTRNIQVHKADAQEDSWITVVSQEKTFDLVAIQGAEVFLGSENVSSGNYTQIRLDVTKVIVTLDGKDITAKLPSDKLKVVGPWEVKAGQKTILTLDFEADKFVVITGKDQAQVMPVIKLEVSQGERPLKKPTPTVSSTIPANLATGVALNSKITATFSKAMESLTLTTATFSLKQGTTPVSGTVTYAGVTATFTPAVNLASSTNYTATITTGAKDLAGNALAVNKVWTFTTGITITGRAPVPLGSAGNFAILAKSGISTTGTTSIVGDIGVSPMAATYITGFGLIMDASNTFATSSLVTGKVYAADYTPPTPAYMTTAVSDMETAYTDAAGRTLPDFTELGAGNIDGMTLAPGLYKWGTGVTIPIGVTLSGGANDIWIFQIAGNLIVGNGAVVTLSSGAQAKNIFWQVAGKTTLGTTSQFKGNILCQTLIEMNTGATLNGRALAQTAVTLIANTIVKPAP